MVKILRESNGIKEMPLDCLKGATLLSIEEAANLTQEERKCTYRGQSCQWWLRSQGCDFSSVATVFHSGDINRCGKRFNDEFNFIRPAIIIDIGSSGLQIGDSFDFDGYTFVIISNQYALCNEAIKMCEFRDVPSVYEALDGNVYEKSDAKKFVDNWFRRAKCDAIDLSQHRPTDDMLAAEQDYGF